MFDFKGYFSICFFVVWEFVEYKFLCVFKQTHYHWTFELYIPSFHFVLNLLIYSPLEQ